MPFFTCKADIEILLSVKTQKLYSVYTLPTKPCSVVQTRTNTELPKIKKI